MTRNNAQNSSTILSEVKSIVIRGSESEKKGNLQEALDFYEDARFLALDSGLVECDVRIDPKSALVETEIVQVKRSQISGMMQDASIKEKIHDLAGSLKIIKNALKVANDIDATDLVPGLREKIARFEELLRPVRISRNVAGYRTIGHLLIFFTILILASLSIELFSIGVLAFYAWSAACSGASLLVSLAIPMKHVKWNITVSTIISALFSTFFVIHFMIVQTFSFVQSIIQSYKPIYSMYSSTQYNFDLLYSMLVKMQFLYPMLVAMQFLDGIVAFILGIAIGFYISAYRASRFIKLDAYAI